MRPSNLFAQSISIASVQGGTLIKGTVPLPGGATAIYSGTTAMPYIRHLDWLGSARLSTTWAHTVQSKVAYAPFGETYNEAGASSNDRSFTGQDQDTVSGNAATGIYDFLFRKYDPAAGRWLSPDPSGWSAVGEDEPQSLNRYAYDLNNPETLADPYGLCPVHVTWQSCFAGNCTSTSFTTDDGYVCIAPPVNMMGVSEGPSLNLNGPPTNIPIVVGRWPRSR